LADLVLAVFNLLRAFPMDGGRVLPSVLSSFTDRAGATRVAAGIGQFLAIVFVFLGFFYNFWLGLFAFSEPAAKLHERSWTRKDDDRDFRPYCQGRDSERFKVLTPNDTLDQVCLPPVEPPGNRIRSGRAVADPESDIVRTFTQRLKLPNG
jgi:hypothetical protein